MILDSNHFSHSMQCRLRGLFKKYREFWISAGYVYSIFDFLCRYVGTHPSLMPTTSAILNVQLIFDSCFCLDVFWLVFDLYLFSFGNEKKSQGTRSGEYGSCGNIVDLGQKLIDVPDTHPSSFFLKSQFESCFSFFSLILYIIFLLSYYSNPIYHLFLS